MNIFNLSVAIWKMAINSAIRGKVEALGERPRVEDGIANIENERAASHHPSRMKWSGFFAIFTRMLDDLLPEGI